MKEDNQVIDEFNEYVNMTASELEKWLKSDDSQDAGWPKGSGDGESVGHDSGRQIIEILKSNLKKDPEKYSSEQIQHMRKVVAYCKRHLAQEEKMLKEKTAEEVKKTKSYASLKNWGHDPLKNEGCHDQGDEDSENEKNSGDEEQAGDKRKASYNQNGQSKKRETTKGAGNKASNGKTRKAKQEAEADDTDEDMGQDEAENEDDDQDDDQGNQKEEGQDESQDEEDEEGDNKKGSAKTKKGPKPGDTVSWSWGQGNPKGKVLDVKEEKTTITTKRGSKVTRDGDPEDPAVVLHTGKSKAIKSNHELN